MANLGKPPVAAKPKTPAEAERQAVRNRARLQGKEPTTKNVTATIAKNKVTRAKAAYAASATGPEREAIRARATAAGKTPTTKSINATYASNKSRRAEADAETAKNKAAATTTESSYDDEGTEYKTEVTGDYKVVKPKASTIGKTGKGSTRTARSAIAARAKAKGKTPTTKSINATYAKNKAKAKAKVG
jgi:hypothetical protein